MKKTLRMMGLCALAALTLAGCKKNEPAGSVSFKATISQPTTNAKTGVGAVNMLVWNAGDQIKVYKDLNTSALFTTTDDNTITATFSGDIAESDTYVAFYPAQNVTVSGSNYELQLSAQQNGAANTFAPYTYPMYATSDGNGNFTFDSPCALMAIPLNGNATIGSIELTGSGDEKLAGKYVINPDDMDNPQFVGEQSTVTLSFDESGLPLSAENNTVVYFALPADRLANGFSVVFKDVAGTELLTKTVQAHSQNNTQSKYILMMPEVNVAAPADGFNITNQGIGEASFGGGLFILLGVGLGIVTLKKKEDEQ